ncbi:2-hydroxyacid dehydrogenase [Rhodospirillum rubrum]|uniref:Glycolate reductase n=1 Tax=Rhodospirillum rubrum (strain ATCC 11170 / ATH 1.1.1 / DSM 467 / LMG 4362 / NCIMB 8255 / S1) TaxID=269796 RepID=Q2RTD0_RHORT|nr:D-glycerate dehydrogenase [Rhodospirillum rubrum]ABC22615.1 Glycolate reductase [Rhodospirillum rubrum ATCC 11170]AEO48333.1 glycolate reductase [Rhodospirillum rubrum F11]MBK5954203.1 D-glycerate dehydrogenase [Rhodospirillum rubrum]QXG82238.1 D-glycerate dehydrogenase [Rhodospirillum rubrum]HAQ00810.1 D-glycerate dehydrogenase [Rhodospirillum rubrum]
MLGKPVVLVTRTLPAAVEERLLGDYDVWLNRDDRPIPPEDLPALARRLGAQAMLVTPTDRLERAVIEALPNSVAIIASFSVGYEHIDHNAAARRGILVTNTPGVLSDATADIALLLMLGAARRASEGERLVRSGYWKGLTPVQLLGRHLHGQRLGILGMGRIGQALAERARPLGLEIHYHNRTPIAEDAAKGAIFHATVEDLLAVSDVLSLHCPATPLTRKLLNAERLALLPPGAIVVNTARGILIDDEALIAALNSGQVFAAGLDVYDNEPDLHPAYRSLPNVFLLPHLGSATIETRTAMGFLALDNLDAYFGGREPPHRIA